MASRSKERRRGPTHDGFLASSHPIDRETDPLTRKRWIVKGRGLLTYLVRNQRMPTRVTRTTAPESSSVYLVAVHPERCSHDQQDSPPRFIVRHELQKEDEQSPIGAFDCPADATHYTGQEAKYNCVAIVKNVHGYNIWIRKEQGGPRSRSMHRLMELTLPPPKWHYITLS